MKPKLRGIFDTAYVSKSDKKVFWTIDMRFYDISVDAQLLFRSNYNTNDTDRATTYTPRGE